MNKRITKVTTKTGDKGTTGMASGARISKADPVIVSIGEIDELNSLIGYLSSQQSAKKYKDTLRMKSYFRVDLGMSYDFLYKQAKNKTFWSKYFNQAILSFEVFNLLGINNVLSKQWIQDVNGVYYSIPNYLTQRRFNLKLILRLK